MPFSSSPVNVSPGDQVQVRYPTPSTWNTQVTVNVQVGTGTDPDGITFGTKIPDALPGSFSFINQQGFSGAFNGTSSSGGTSTFQKNTTYYSQVIDISSIEIPIPASISAVSNGPKNNNTNNTTAQFRIYRGGAFDSWRTSINANVPNGTGGLQPGDKIQLRVTVPNWYVTSTLVTFNVGDETFGTGIGQPSTSFSRQWGITTRAQDQNINQYAFTDAVDQKATYTIPWSFTGTSIVGSGDGVYQAPGINELGGFVTPDGSDYLMMGSFSSPNVSPRIAELDIDTSKATKLVFNVISGNDNNGGERPNNPTETFFVRLNDGSTTRDAELIPTLSGYSGGTSAYDSIEGSWHDVTVNLNSNEKISDLEIQLRSTGGDPELSAVPSSIVNANLNANDAYAFRYVKIYQGSTLIDTIWAAGDGGPSWIYDTVAITAIDSDVVLRATSTSQLYISTDQYTWSQSIGAQLVLGDTLYTRLRVGPNNTQKRTGNLNVFAVAGDTLSGGYENTSAGTYGSGTYQVTQTLGTVTDNWQSWTEVDRYPELIYAEPIFTYGAKLALTGAQPTGGFAPGNNYNVSGGSGNSMVVGLTTDGFNDLIIVDPGYGYSIGNNVTISAGGQTAQLQIIEYEKVLVSADEVHDRAEPGFMYFADFTVTGLGTEYNSGTYNNLEAPLQNLSNNNISLAQNLVSQLNGIGVQMNAIIDGTGGFIRKNNTGSWVQQLTVQQNDIINLKIKSSTTYENVVTARVTIQGPPNGNPSIGNPTGGPSPSYPNKSALMTLITRDERTVPYPFKATPIYLADPSTEQIAVVAIKGLDANTTATITGGIGSVSVDQVNWGSSTTILSTSPFLYVRQNSSASSGGLAQVTYRIGNNADVSAGDALFDSFRVYTKQFNVLGDFITEEYFGAGFTNFTEYTLPAFAATQFYIYLIGAGGGDGGGDVPNSSGGPGGSGNILRCLVNIPNTSWPTDGGGNPDFKLRIYPGDSGDNGDNYSSSSGGGTGGFGYCFGGAGGNAGPNDASGAGGGGGGSSAITFSDNTLIAMAGGGGGGGGAGNDTAIPLLTQYGNYDTNGTSQTTTVNLQVLGDDGPNGSGQGGGAGGGGGGYDGSAGTLIASYTENGVTLQTNDLDATGGNGGGNYYNTAFVTPLGSPAPTGEGAAPGDFGTVYLEFGQQDITPDAFTFTTLDGIGIQETVLSNIVQITGITGTVPVSVSSPGFAADVRICNNSTAASCGAFTPGAQIGNGQYLQIRAITGNLFFSTYSVAVTVGDTTNYWDINTGPPPDSTPNVFFIQDAVDVPINTPTISEEIVISGITVPVSITATNGADISVEGGAYVNGATGTTIQNGETFTVRLTSSADFEDTVTTQVTVGNLSAVEWNVVTTSEADSQPDSYTWIFVVGGNLVETYESNTNLIDGLGTTSDFIVESGSGDADPGGLLPRIKKNGVLLDAGVTTTTVNNFDTLALVYTTTDIIGESRVFNTKLGLASATTQFYETPWSVITAGQFGTTPNDFTFATQIAPAVNTFTEAAEEIVISGLSNGISVGLFGTNGVQFNINGGGYNLYTVNTQANVSNGDIFTIRLLSSEIPGFTRTAFIIAGSYSTGYNVQSPANVQDPISSQWYSSITPCKYIGNTFSGQQIRFNTKFDGLPVGTIMPVFQDALESDFWGLLNGKLNSRFPSWVYCDGGYYSPEDYPLLFSVLGYDYGAKAVGSVTFFRTPDYRNKYVKGTGVIDGTSASSPGLAPEFTKTKQSGSPGNQEPGSFGGMWFVDTIGDPGVDELEQVITPATGQPAQQSEYFGIAQVSTAGYSNVTGLIEFISTGSATCPIGLDPEKIFDTPLHFHDLISGVADPGRFKGRVTWNGNGGYGVDVTSPLVAAGSLGSSTIATETSSGQFFFNLWGYATDDYDLTSGNVPGSTGCDYSGWWDGTTTNWSDGTTPGYEGINNAGEFGAVLIEQTQIQPGSSNYDEINDYIDLNNQPFVGQTGAVGASSARKFVTTVDIPEKTVTVGSYNPINKLKHNHYVSLTSINDNSIYGFGNNETGGTGSTALNNFSGGINSSVDLEFSALDVGIQVLPGTFTLQQTKQLIPVPEFSPQDKVPLVTPYVWSKWMIKAF